MTNSPAPEFPAQDHDPDAYVHTPEPKSISRKSVQSTLFRCKSQENELNCDGKKCAVVEVEDRKDDGQCCGSQTKRKQPQRRNRKTTPQSRTTKMINFTPTKKEACNGHGGAGSGQCTTIRVEGASPLAVHSLKIGANLVRGTLFPCDSQVVEADGHGNGNCNINGNGDGGGKSTEGQDCVDECGGSQKDRKRKGKTTSLARTPKKVKENRLNSVPKKRRTSNGHASASSVQSSPIKIEKAFPPPIPNLRLEAKLKAEEAARIYSGKQIHPFFTSRKVGKKINETNKEANNWSLVEQKDKHADLGPIHVFESTQNDNASFNWRSWTFHEKTSISSQHHAEGSLSSIFEGSVKVSGFDTLLKDLYTSSFSNSQNKMCLNYHDCKNGYSRQISNSFADVADNESLSHSPDNLEVDNRTNEVHCLASDAYKCRKIESRQIRSFKNQTADSLWTDKYQPRKAEEVCGNTESVKLLNEWLHHWHEVNTKNCRKFCDYDERDIDDDDYGYYSSDCDTENIHKEAILKNVLLIKGPAGSGKTAAIYACAKEQGFRVLEANASDCRNGAVLKHKFGEALQSLWRSRPKTNSANSTGKRNKKLSFSPHKNAKTDPEKEVTEVIMLSDEEDIKIVGSPGELVYEKLDSAHDQGELKPLILFEDLDIVFPEDRGFLSAIQDIAETAKGPVILTSSIENPIIPDNMDLLEVCFKALTQRELLQCAHMVCVSERANIHPHLLEKLIACCYGDIRKTIMCLQYFCVGGKHELVDNLLWLCDPLHHDLSIGHQLLPTIFPWNLYSLLSELVERETSQSAFRLTKHSNLTDLFQDHTAETETMEMQKSIIEAKKEAMLSRNFSAYDCNVLATLLDNADRLSNYSSMPVALSNQISRRKSETVMKSGIGDALSKGWYPLVSGQNTENELYPEVHCKEHSPQRGPQSFQFPLAYDPTEAKELDEQQYPNMDAAAELYLNNTSMLCDVSVVPESSYVPETVDQTEQTSKIVSFGHVANSMEVSVNNERNSVSSPTYADSTGHFAPMLHQSSNAPGHCFHANLDCSNFSYVEDSQHNHVEALPEYPVVMDECSRIDFNKRLKFVDRLEPLTATDLVQESWKNLRNRHPDLRQYVAAEDRDASCMLELAYGATKLLSEADILLSNCQLLINESFESSVSEVLDVFSWYNQQLHLTSTIVQHGFGCYMKDGSSLRPIEDCQPGIGYPSEMFTLRTNSIEKADIVPEDKKVYQNSPAGPRISLSLEREMHSCIDVIHSIVPSRSHLTLRGTAFLEYLSSLGNISRSEAIRLSGTSGKLKRGRGRTARHYLSTGAMALTPEDISLLDHCSYYGKTPSQPSDANTN